MKQIKLKKNTTKTRFAVALWVIGGLILLFLAVLLNYLIEISNHPEWNKSFFVIIANNVLPALATIAFLSGAWEARSKRAFAREVLELAHVSDNYIQSGIKYVYKEFTDITWDDLFIGAKEVVFFFTYAYSWRNNNRTALKLLQKQGTKITVIMPDYTNEKITDALDMDFHYGEHADRQSKEKDKNSRKLIEEAKEYYEKIGANLLFYPGNIKSTYYMIDDKCIYAPFKHSEEKSNVPAFLCVEGGTLFEFCKKDLESIIKQSKTVGE